MKRNRKKKFLGILTLILLLALLAGPALRRASTPLPEESQPIGDETEETAHRDIHIAGGRVIPYTIEGPFQAAAETPKTADSAWMGIVFGLSTKGDMDRYMHDLLHDIIRYSNQRKEYSRLLPSNHLLTDPALRRAPVNGLPIAVPLANPLSAPQNTETAGNETEETTHREIHTRRVSSDAIYSRPPKGPLRAAAENYKTVDPAWMEPISGLSTYEEMDHYVGDLLHDIVCHPDKKIEYTKIFTWKSLQAFDHLEYVYVNREYAWPMVETEICEILRDGYDDCMIDGRVIFRPDLITLDKKKLVINENLWEETLNETKNHVQEIRFCYLYEKKTGLISIYLISQLDVWSWYPDELRRISCFRCMKQERAPVGGVALRSEYMMRQNFGRFDLETWSDPWKYLYDLENQ